MTNSAPTGQNAVLTGAPTPIARHEVLQKASSRAAQQLARMELAISGNQVRRPSDPPAGQSAGASPPGTSAVSKVAVSISGTRKSAARASEDLSSGVRTGVARTNGEALPELAAKALVLRVLATGVLVRRVLVERARVRKHPAADPSEPNPRAAPRANPQPARTNSAKADRPCPARAKTCVAH